MVLNIMIKGSELDSSGLRQVSAAVSYKYKFLIPISEKGGKILNNRGTISFNLYEVMFLIDYVVILE